MNAFLSDINAVLAIISLSITLTAIVGSFFAYRNLKANMKRDLAKEAAEFQERANIALQAEIGTLKDQIDRLQSRINALESENNHLNGKLDTVNKALRRKNMFITMEGELISASDYSQQPHNGQTGRISGATTGEH